MNPKIPPDLQVTIAKYSPFLSEIRKRLLFTISVFLIAWVVGFIYYQPIASYIIGLYNFKGVNVTFTSPFQFISLALNLGMVAGLVVVSPLVIYQFLSFIKPALRPIEYRLVLKLLPVSLFLFIAGFLFGTWMMKFIISMYSQQSTGLNIGNLWDVNKFLSQFFLTSVLLGLLFQLPIVLTILLRLGVVKHSSVVKQRIPIYALLLILVILLPPTDLLSLVMMLLPLAIIFEITLLLNRNILIQRTDKIGIV